MKRFISLLVALVLLVSMFALPTLAFAEEAAAPGTDESNGATHEVGFSVEAFKKLVVASNPGLYVEMDSSFKLNQDWIEDAEKIHELFPGINYYVLPAVDEDLDEVDSHTITYVLGDETHENHAKDKESTPASSSYKKSQHATLQAAVAAEDGWAFGGWYVPVTRDGEKSNEALLYRARDQFVMLDEDITVYACWYQTSEDEEVEAPEFKYPLNDRIGLEYCTPSDDPRDEHWTRVDAFKTISVQTSGWWMFRYVVVDGASEDINDDDAVLINFNEKLKSGEYTREDFSIKRYAADTSSPKIALSSSMETKMKDGLTVGTSYAISTSLDVTDSSSTTTTYVVYRHDGNGAANGDDDGHWVKIYDSAATDKVLEGGKDYIASNGAINPVSSDVTADGFYRYKVVYTVKDANGFFGVAKDEDSSGEVDKDSGEFHPVLLLGVKLSTKDTQNKAKMETWKIVLFVIAGLSAVGIVVLLLIKPKQAVAGDARVNNAKANSDKQAQENEPVEEDKQADESEQVDGND